MSHADGSRPGGAQGGFGGKWEILLAVGGFVVLIDALTKWIVRRSLALGHPLEIVGDSVRLTYVLNPGAAFGIHAGPHSRVIFLVLALLALAVLGAIAWHTPRGDRMRLFSVALVAGGATGNLLDRIRSPLGVVDFLDVGIGSVRWPVFNAADVAVTVGALLLATSFWMEERRLAARTDGVGGRAPSRSGDEARSLAPEGAGSDGA